MMTAQEKVYVILAQEMGEEVQFRVRENHKDNLNRENNLSIYGPGWRDLADSARGQTKHEFNFSSYDYRVKPYRKPKASERWISADERLPRPWEPVEVRGRKGATVLSHALNPTWINPAEHAPWDMQLTVGTYWRPLA